MNTTPSTHAIVTDLGTQWFDLLGLRNEAPYGSAKYNRAEAKMTILEDKASMLIFNDTDHTMCECLNGREEER
jgi:hypothetical protein